ncbi:UNVERIFIED_CONTAM: hypothetical protein HDU68_001599, partial [Siphonaria sp. JEL0065]
MIIFFTLLVGSFSIRNLVPYATSFASAQGAAYDVYNVIDPKPSFVKSATDGVDISRFANEIEFRNVNFHYTSRPDVPVLNKLNLKVPLGKTVALLDAAKSANAYKFIKDLPHVGERGSLLSRGQKQRVAIATLPFFYSMKLPLFVVQERSRRCPFGRTTVVIVQRLSTIKDADLIVVLEKGKLFENQKEEDGSRTTPLPEAKAAAVMASVSSELVHVQSEK